MAQYSFRKEDSDPKILIAVLLILIVVLGAALIMIITQRGEPEPAPEVPNETIVQEIPEEPENETNVTEVCGDSCHYDMAVAGMNFSECQQIENATLRQDCYEELSSVSMDACTALEDLSKKEECITAFATAQGNISMCDYLEDSLDCQLAVDPCLLSDNMKLCRAVEYEDPSECGQDTDCLLNYSITKKDKDACELIQNTAVSVACASVIDSMDNCKTLEKQAQRDYCYQLYAIYTDDYLECSEITENTQYAIDCFATFAARRGDVEICEADGFKLDTMWECYTKYSLMSGNISGCERIHELAKTNKFNCAFEFAKQYGDPSACTVIDSLVTRDTCYQGAMIYSNENLKWENCAGVTDFNWRNKCYTESAKLYDDITLCDYAEEDYAQRSCRDAYELYKSQSG